MASGPAIDAERVIADLRELQRRTGDDDGAQRLCWGEGWRRAREFLGELLGEIGLEPEVDEAGNLWAYLRRRLRAGPRGRLPPRLGPRRRLARRRARGDGRARGAAGLGRRRAKPAAVARAGRLGRRGGRPVRPQPVRQLGRGGHPRSGGARGRARRRRPAGRRACWPRTASSSSGCSSARSRLERIGSYLELHIEQGPVLEAEGIRAAAVTGCAGVERVRFVISRPGLARGDDADGRAPRRRPRRGRDRPAGRGDRAEPRAASARSAA